MKTSQPRNSEDEMNLEDRLELVTKETLEIITPAELRRVLEEKKKPRAYWGFECSGKQSFRTCPE